MSEEKPLQVFSGEDPTTAAVMPWQSRVLPGAYCVFCIHLDKGVQFAYFHVHEVRPNNFLYGASFSDTLPEPSEPEYVEVHRAELFQPISLDQFNAARATGFGSDAASALIICNYSDWKGEA